MSIMNNKSESIPIGSVSFADGRFEFRCPEHDLVVRGRYLEWVLEAAAEVIARTEQIRSEGDIEEMKMLAEFGQGPSQASIDAARFEARQRFGAVPQCVVSMGADDYRWIQRDARKDNRHPCTDRIVDQSLTRQRGEWLQDEPRVN